MNLNNILGITVAVLSLALCAWLILWTLWSLHRLKQAERLHSDLCAFFLDAQGNESAHRCIWAMNQPDFDALTRGFGRMDRKLWGRYADQFRAWRTLRR